MEVKSLCAMICTRVTNEIREPVRFREVLFADFERFRADAVAIERVVFQLAVATVSTNVELIDNKIEIEFLSQWPNGASSYRAAKCTADVVRH
jgi:hypothetical protein